MNFEFIAGSVALDFANTVHDHSALDPEDDLKAPSDLVLWARQAGLVTKPERGRLLRRLQTSSTSADFKRALKLRDLVYELFSGIAGGDRVGANTLNALNFYLRAAMSRPAIRGAGKRYELAWETGDDVVDRFLAKITRSAVDLVTSPQLERVRQCAGDRCTWLFLDTSRNGMRRWCDMQACGNRSKIRRFRRRNQQARAG